MLAKSYIFILLNKKTVQPCTVVMDGLNRLNSYWQFSHVNLNMINCHAALLTLKLQDIRNVTVENSTFGYWIFNQVDHVFFKNSSSASVGGFSTLVNFYNSSGLMENVVIKDVNFTRNFEAIIILNNSYVHITNSNFINNKVRYGVIQALNSSTLDMSDCILQNNQADHYVGAIYAENSTVRITNTNFYDSKALQGIGAYLINHSTTVFNNCTFRNNSDTAVKFLYHTTASIVNCNFQSNRGPLYISEFSIVNVSHTTFLENSAQIGGAITIDNNSSSVVLNCSFSWNTAFYINKDIIKSGGSGGAIFIMTSAMEIVLSRFYNNYADGEGGSVISFESSLLIHNTIFKNNIAGSEGGAIEIYQSYLTIYDSSLTITVCWK